ncbi:glycosyltransferase [Winogradskyella psychrotolerans]|uniref:glycosyltransferase n=1 Tax=Winogradskyella psychrotolerans TaxID=1344585 RepID=UPI001C078BB8|nr:glycosyltransferase [Winogradskyella psychrotolerans]MBU2930040.1 glycosyltransferase [Winogradskyella psychrotolerans]
MKAINFSFIIPVYNRPNEIKELLDSYLNVEGEYVYEIVIIEDGSTETSETVVKQFNNQLNIAYYFKPNSGPGDSRNYGMQKAKGNYFIILDSDVLLPPHYLNEVQQFLEASYYDCFGGPDAAHSSFSNLQKAINFAMTSFITTGGIRGGKQQVENFQPRSFNMGLSKKAFQASGGFGKIHPGEDPDLSLRLHQLGFKTTLIESAFVYHKRRVSWSKFYKQVYKFGMVRPILNQWHPDSKSIVYWFPTVFSLGCIVSILLAIFQINLLLYVYGFYFALAFLIALITNRNLSVALQALFAIIIQFFGYGYGFLKSTFNLLILGRDPKEAFPELFF